MQKEIELFRSQLKKDKLKITPQRLKILQFFLKTERHLSCDDLYRLIRKNNPEIGYATVYRTLKLIRKTGLAREVDFGDRIARLEHEFGHQHHDHLVCLKCGKFFEVCSPEIEQLQEKLAKAHSFNAVRHTMDIFGYCRRCK